MSHVHDLLQRTRRDVEKRKASRSTVSLPQDDRRVHWSRNRFHFIAEIKRASLSAGEIRADLNLDGLARSYQHAGASAISVLTEKHYFHGSLQDLTDVKSKVHIPVLQKDFIIDEFQIAEAKTAGADFVLLIVRFLTSNELYNLYQACTNLTLNCIVEITDKSDLQKITFPVEYLGVNSRNLETLETDTSKFARLRDLLPDSFLIAESGISTLKQLSEIQDLGYNGVLIGEHLLRAADPATELSRFTGFTGANRKAKVKICGITNERDATGAVTAGADALGFIFADSPRKIDRATLRHVRRSVPASVLTIGVFRGQPKQEIQTAVSDYQLDAVQTYDEIDSDLPAWHARIVTQPQGCIDTVGSGLSKAGVIPDTKSRTLWDVKASPAVMKQVWKDLSQQTVFGLAGGLNPANVAEAVSICKPSWVDVARGVESSAGVKDVNKITSFIKALRES